jgi:hypothetical protein
MRAAPRSPRPAPTAVLPDNDSVTEPDGSPSRVAPRAAAGRIRHAGSHGASGAAGLGSSVASGCAAALVDEAAENVNAVDRAGGGCMAVIATGGGIGMSRSAPMHCGIGGHVAPSRDRYQIAWTSSVNAAAAPVRTVPLVDEPPVTRRVPGRAGGVGQQWDEPLDPAVDRDVVDLDPTFGEQCFGVAVGQAVAQEPADRH